jgi:uncharacterized protein YcbK (DUF882 family)
MQKTLAAAIAFLTGLVPATAQTTSFKNIFQMTPNAATGSVTPAPQKKSRARGGSVSRACLTAQTRAVLAQLEGHFGAVKVISTCRPGAVIAGSGRPSQHRYGKAVDFVPPPGQRAAMISWLRQHANGMVITYRSGHVHFDTGPWRSYACGDCGKRRAQHISARRAYARSTPTEPVAATQSIPH